MTLTAVVYDAAEIVTLEGDGEGVRLVGRLGTIIGARLVLFVVPSCPSWSRSVTLPNRITKCSKKLEGHKGA